MSMGTTTPAKDTLSRLNDEVNSFSTLVRDFPHGAEVRHGSSWTPHDVLAHLVFWHENYASILSAVLNGEQPRLLVGSFRELNDQAVAENAGQPVPPLVNRFKAAQAKLERLVALGEGRLLQVRIKEGSKERDLDEFLERVEAHVRGHSTLLKRQGRGRRGGNA